MMHTEAGLAPADQAEAHRAALGTRPLTDEQLAQGPDVEALALSLWRRDCPPLEEQTGQVGRGGMRVAGGAQSGYYGRSSPFWGFLLKIVTTVLTPCYSSFSCPGTQIRFSWILAS